MRANLYQALGIPKGASDDEVRAALRAQIRKYYARTRDGQGNVEEALRFINHASRILSDPELRAQYDHDLEASGGTVDQRIEHVVTTAITRVSKDFTPVGAARTAPPPAGVSRRRGPDAGAGKAPHHPGLTERVVPVRHSPTLAIALCVLFGLFIVVAITLVTPADAVQAAKQVLTWVTVSLLALTAVYGVVHGVALTQRRHQAATPALVPPQDLAVLNWRRQKSVFLGTNQPQEDASWVFQLRMAELERARLGRTSEPRPWNRLGARLFDYALWGLMLAVPLSELRSLGAVTAQMAYWLTHPLVAPVLITASWMAVETVLIATTQTTPGKWLFGVYLQFSISDAYAARDPRTQLRRAAKRAFRVWWEGVGCGFPLFSPILIAIAYERVAAQQETAWDFAEDCLVTHGPMGALNAVTGVAGLAAMLWVYGVAWHQPTGQAVAWARSSLVSALPSPAAISSGALFGRGITFGTQGAPASAAPPATVAALASDAGRSPADSPGGARREAPIDPEIAALFAARNERVAVLKVEGPRMLEARNFRQAAELCRDWAELELGNANAWGCLGRAQQALGNHQEAVNAFRRAKQYDPNDSTLDAEIRRSQRGIVADFLNRRGQ